MEVPRSTVLTVLTTMPITQEPPVAVVG
jgi:hypothetical protein